MNDPMSYSTLRAQEDRQYAMTVDRRYPYSLFEGVFPGW